jgi:hypothetical protein
MEAQLKAPASASGEWPSGTLARKSFSIVSAQAALDRRSPQIPPLQRALQEEKEKLKLDRRIARARYVLTGELTPEEEALARKKTKVGGPAVG